jgi:hypothetical protein
MVDKNNTKMNEQKAKQSLIGFHPDFFVGWSGGQILKKFQQDLETSS